MLQQHEDDGNPVMKYKQNTGTRAAPVWENKTVWLTSHTFRDHFGTRPGINGSIPFSDPQNDPAIQTIRNEADLHHAVNVHIHDRLQLDGVL